MNQHPPRFSPRHPVEELALDECWQLLDDTLVGRLAVDVAGQPDIFPINYIVDGRSLVFRSEAGTKLAAAVIGRYVAVEIDGACPDDRTVWSVVVKGLAREISNMFERFDAEELPLYPWVATPKPNFVRIDPLLVTGRRFHVVDGVDLARHAGYPAHADDDTHEPSKPTGWTLAVLPGGELPYHPGAPRLHPD